MNTTSKMLSMSLLAAVMIVGATGAQADMKSEKCYGVVKAGKNDCKTGAHACASHGKMDASGSEFIVLPQGLCAKLENGSTKPVMDDGMMMNKSMDKLNK